MPKSIARIVFAVLISLGIIAATSPNVQASLGSMLRRVESSNTAYVSTNNQSMSSATMGGRARYFQSDDFSHNCNSEDPSLDY